MYQGAQKVLVTCVLPAETRNTMNAVRTPRLETLVSELHAAIKAESSVPKVAKAIGMSYSSLRDNLSGVSDIRLKTVYAILDEIGWTMEELTQRALLREERSED